MKILSRKEPKDVFNFRLNDELREKMRNKSEKWGISMSAFINIAVRELLKKDEL